MWVFWEDGAPQRPLVLHLSMGAHLDMPLGMLGLRLLQEAETVGKRGPTQRRRHYHPQLLSWWLGPEITRWQVNIHFCVKDVSLVWGRLFLLSRRQWRPATVLLPGNTPKTERPGRLQSMGWLRVGHDWATSLSLFTFLNWRRKWQPTLVFLPGEFQGWWSMMGCCLWRCTESDTTEAT